MTDKQLILCPNCGRGTLEKMTFKEKMNNDLDTSLEYLGCDECKYAIEEEYFLNN